MSKLKVILPLIGVLVLALWAATAVIKAMPDRYVMRLPEPLQQIGLPQDSVPILPTVSGPENAVALLQPTAIATTIATVTAVPPTTTTTNSQVEAVIDEPATSTPQPTSTIPPPTPTATPWPLPSAARLDGFQHKFQEWNNCGPATLAMALTYFGMNVSQNDTAAILKPDPEDRNVSPQEMVDYVNMETPNTAVFRANGNREMLRRLIANNIPVIIEIGIEPPGEFRWMGWYGHYLLIVAYDDNAEQFWVYDSWFGTSDEPLKNANAEGRILTYDELETYWPHFNRNYLTLSAPEQQAQLEHILGVEADDQLMWQNALVTAQTDAAADPENAFYWFNLGTNYNALGHYEEAALAFDQARAIGLPWRMLWYQFGPYEAYYETGRFEDIVLLADVTLKDRPYFEESFYYRGLALAALGQEQEAQQQLQKATEFNPNYMPAMNALENMSEN